MIKTSKINYVVRSYKEKKPHIPAYYLFLTLGCDITISVIIAGGLGYIVDKYMSTKPAFVILFLVIGFIAGFRKILK